MIVERVNSGLARAKAKGVKLGRGKKKDGERSADEKRWGMSRAELEKRILRLYKDGTGMGLAELQRLGLSEQGKSLESLDWPPKGLHYGRRIGRMA